MEVTERKPPRSRKKKPVPVRKKVMIGAAAVVLAGAAVCGFSYFSYIREARQYAAVFFPNTIINGMDVSLKSVDEVRKLAEDSGRTYGLTIKGRGGTSETITGEEIGMRIRFDESLENCLAAQDPMDWGEHRGKSVEYQFPTEAVYDADLLKERVGKLAVMDDGSMTEPGNAYLSEYIEGRGYEVVPGEPGTVLDKDAVTRAVMDAVAEMRTELVLEDLGVYKEPEVTADDPDLKAEAERLNRYVTTKITYRFGEEEEILDGSRIAGWITAGEDGAYAISRESVAAYVKELADKYDTSGKEKSLKTTYGPVVTLHNCPYGWKIDQEAETEQLYALLTAGESQDREPVYAQTAASRGENDYGNTYVEVNLTAQHLYFYKDGAAILETDFVSGSLARRNDTPEGAYPVAYKARNTVLRGANYASYVNYWIPFNGGIGLHDATWRGAFGGNIYRTSGSHGCLNLPLSAAKAIYENISKGDPVLCYMLENTSGSANPEKSTPPASSGGAETAPETEPAPAETEPAPAEAEPAPAETGANVPEGPGAGPGGGGAEGPGAGPGSGGAEGPGADSGNDGAEDPGVGPGGGGAAGPGAGPGSGSAEGPDAEPGSSSAEGPGADSGSSGAEGPGGDSGNGGAEGPGADSGNSGVEGPDASLGSDGAEGSGEGPGSGEAENPGADSGNGGLCGPRVPA